MNITDIYKRYFSGDCTVCGIKRSGVSVSVTAVYDDGTISYEMLVNFFPHEDEEDFRITSDAAVSRTLYSGKGRRSKKREEQIYETLRADADQLAEELGGVIDWDHPIGLPADG